MSEYEKLNGLIQDATELIAHGTTADGTEFIGWKNKAELFVNRIFGEKSLEYEKFTKIHYDEIDWAKINGLPPTVDHVAKCKKGLQIAKGMLESFRDDMPENSTASIHLEPHTNFQKVFIVHGHDGELKESVARIIEKQGIEAVILSERANKGRTIIEKFEEYSDVAGAVCLFTADDVGKAKSTEDTQPRARQNVVFEAGYFIGKLGRNHIVILADHGVEMPSDLSGVVHADTGNWQFDLIKELKAMGYAVDANKLL